VGIIGPQLYGRHSRLVTASLQRANRKATGAFLQPAGLRPSGWAVGALWLLVSQWPGRDHQRETAKSRGELDDTNATWVRIHFMVRCPLRHTNVILTRRRPIRSGKPHKCPQARLPGMPGLPPASNRGTLPPPPSCGRMGRLLS
jgi:hypothetical protein